MTAPKARPPLAVGDRVRVFDVCRETQLLTSDTGTIREIRLSGALFIGLNHWGFTSETVWHPRQCVRLVKRQRRECWITYHLPSGTWGGIYQAEPTAVVSPWIVLRMREVPRGKS